MATLSQHEQHTVSDHSHILVASYSETNHSLIESFAHHIYLPWWYRLYYDTEHRPIASRNKHSCYYKTRSIPYRKPVLHAVRRELMTDATVPDSWNIKQRAAIGYAEVE